MGRARITMGNVLCRGIIARCLMATWMLGATLPASAQTPELPDAANVVDAYRTARQWLNTFQPPALDDPAAAVPIAGAAGVCVILRQSGRVVGIGHDERGDDFMLRRAMGRAMGQVLGDAAVAGLPDSMRDDIGAALVLELDVAGRFIPQPGRTFAQIADRLDPARHGVATRRGDRWAVVYPAQLQSMNTARQLPGLLRAQALQLGFEPLTLREIQERGGDISIYGFLSVHLAQQTPTGFPRETYRGGAPVLAMDVTPERLGRVADELFDHITTHRWPDAPPPGFVGDFVRPPGLKGDYRPVSDDYHPVIAPALDQALTAFALLRYSVARADVDPIRASQAQVLARTVLEELVADGPSRDEEVMAPATAAALVYAISELPTPRLTPNLSRALTEALGRIRERQGVDGSFSSMDEDGRTRQSRPHDTAMMAGALARSLARELPGAPTPAQVRRGLDAAWSSVPPQQRVGLLPWIGWGEADLGSVSSTETPRWDFLRELHASLEASRLYSADHRVPPDLDGGFMLTGRALGSNARATAQTLRPAAWLAGTRNHPHLFDENRSDLAWEGHLRTMRFLIQLTVQPASAWRYRGSARACGGVRAALWDSDQPLAAQALGLLAVSETILALDGAPASNNDP